MIAVETIVMLQPPRTLDVRELERALDNLGRCTQAGIAHRCPHCGLVDERRLVGSIVIATHPHECTAIARPMVRSLDTLGVGA
jgi:hypothetical protein